MGNRVVAMHQPNFIPWLGFFYRLAHADIFILVDSVQLSAYSYTNRVGIRFTEGARWLTVPVKHNFGQLIKDVAIVQTKPWRATHLATLRMCYGRYPLVINNHDAPIIYMVDVVCQMEKDGSEQYSIIHIPVYDTWYKFIWDHKTNAAIFIGKAGAAVAFVAKTVEYINSLRRMMRRDN